MAKFNEEEMAEVLLDYVGVYEEALWLAVKIMGSRRQVYEDILFAYTGYREFEDYLEEYKEEEEE